MDKGDARSLRVARRGRFVGRAANAHFAAVRRKYAANDVHQRGFTRAVLAHQTVDLARLELQVYAVQHLDAEKALANILKLQNEFTHNRRLPSHTFAALAAARMFISRVTSSRPAAISTNTPLMTSYSV